MIDLLVFLIFGVSISNLIFLITISRSLERERVEEREILITPPKHTHLEVVELTEEGGFIHGRELEESQVSLIDDSVEEREWREEQNWLNKRKQTDARF